jgi:hypothetical protein
MGFHWGNSVLLSAVVLAGCGQRVVQVRPVTVVATRTAGVAMVVVRPQIARSSSSGGVDRDSHYVLLCDGRGPQGMQCEIVSEVGADRRSRGVVPDRAAPIIDEGVGTLSDVSVRYSEEGTVARDVRPPAPPPTSNAAPAAPAPVPAPAAEPAPAGSPAPTPPAAPDAQKGTP